VEILTGGIATPRELLRGFAMQVVWLLIWWLAYRLVWRRGMRHYGAVGG
jgi:ABC-2 type transport system permease protein